MEKLPKTIVKDGYLSSPEELGSFLENGEIFPKMLLERMKERMESGGDQEVLVNAELGIKNKEEDSMGKQIVRLSDLITQSQNTARILYHYLGVRPGDVVHSSLGNSSYFHYAVLGAWLCNATVTVTDPNLKPDVLSLQLEETGARIIFCHQENLEVIQKTLDKMGKKEAKVIVMGTGKDDNSVDKKEQVYYFDALTEHGCHYKDVPDDVFNTKNDVAAIIWSSGTTGRPKGIRQGFKWFRMFESSTMNNMNDILLTTCFFHASGILFTLNCMYNGGTIFFYAQEAMEDKKAGENLVLAVDKYKPTIMVAGAHHIMELAQMERVPEGVTDLSSLETAIPIGTNVPIDPYQQFKRFFPNLASVANFYTLTEFGNLAAISLATTSLGNVFPGSVLKIVNPDTGKICGPNEVGEIRGRCDMMTVGYLNRPEETAKLYDKEGFMCFGDLGHYNEKGVLYFDGRLKELIKVKNSHLYPVEIEEILMQHPGVKEAGVYGKPDPLLQELVTAVVVRMEGSEVTEEELVRMVDERVDDYKRLRGGVVFVDRLPRNALGKILRRELGALAEGEKKVKV